MHFIKSKNIFQWRGNWYCDFRTNQWIYMLCRQKILTVKKAHWCLIAKVTKRLESFLIQHCWFSYLNCVKPVLPGIPTAAWELCWDTLLPPCPGPVGTCMQARLLRCSPASPTAICCPPPCAHPAGSYRGCWTISSCKSLVLPRYKILQERL